MLTWISANWTTVLTTACTVIAGASAFLKVLETVPPFSKLKLDKVDSVLGKVLSWISVLALNPKK